LDVTIGEFPYNYLMKPKHPATNLFLASGLFDGLNAFSEIEARISALTSNKEIGDAFEVFAEAYLATQKINEAREVWPFEALPLDQRKLLALDTGKDMGVDGTYQTNDGELRAYQVKFRSRRPVLTWDELSTFMGLTDQVSQRVLFTNCEALPSLMRDRSGFIAIRGSDLDRLTPEDFAAMRQWLENGQVKLPHKTPLPHQIEALDAIAAELKDNDRATVVMACGTGKSLVALWAAERHKCHTVLVLVPSLALVRQLLHEWLRETSWENLTFLCVCSDHTVAKGADDLIVHQADLDFPVTRESASVRKFLTKQHDGVKVMFSTYQSADVVAKGMPVSADGEMEPFELGIFDEAHKTASRSGTQFSFALEDNNLPIRKRLFFTATPRHYDIRKKDKEGDTELVYSMDRPSVYGQIAHKLSFAEAARRGIICNYKVVISVVTSDMVNDHLLKHGEVIVAGDAVKARQVALQIALQKAVEKYGVSRIFTFHGSVASARSFTSDDGEGIRHHLTDFITLHVSGAMKTAEREDQMKAFRQAQKAVISNARCLTEGVDVPAVDMVAFMSPRKSKVDIVQATGRAMRKSSGKQFGYVMVPLFLDMSANETIEEALHRTGFADVWDVLAAMKEQDDVLTDIIRQMREDKGHTGGYDENRFSERVEVLGPSVPLDTIRDSITAECIENLSSSWDERYGELLAYKREDGKYNLPPQVSKDNPLLSKWTNSQRAIYRRGALTAERKRKLDEIGFEWEPFANQWEERFAELAAYKQAYGDCNVSSGDINHTQLFTWCSGQRYAYVKKQLTLDKIERLQNIGFVWRPIDAAWEEKFAALSSYKLTYGDCNVPKKWIQNPSLAVWTVKQRMDFRKGALPAERTKRLDELGFEWKPFASIWDEFFAALASYKLQHGDCKVQRDGGDNPKLGKWCAHQREAYQKGKITVERIKRLDELGFSWNTLDSNWESMFAALVKYKEIHGTAYVRSKSKDDYDLGQWCQRQRKKYKDNKFSPDQVKQLEDIGFVWDPLVDNWEKMYSDLLQYKTIHGKSHVPVNKNNDDLAMWCGRQRSAYKSSKLSSEHIKLLENISFIWDPIEARWEEMFAALETYKQTHGDTRIPGHWEAEPKLNQWCNVQRRTYLKNKITEDHFNQLEQLGFVWSPSKSKLKGAI
jgi:superfamily II DNA or RNA helicase